MKKLMNKYTGEIGYLCADNENYKVFDENDKILAVYMTLKAVGEHWEDYEEPKEQYYIKENGVIDTCGAIEDDIPDEMLSKMKQIGNYFSSKEEAEKAVEKLKAWKRLEDKGFRFDGHDDRDRGQLGDIVIYAEMPTFEYDDDSTRDELDLLFGGKE